MRLILSLVIPFILMACTDVTGPEARHYGEVQVPSAKVVVSRYQPVAEGIAAEHAGVPVAYLPPPGFCRIWYPERVPTRQPEVSACNVQVPPGAILVRR